MNSRILKSAGILGGLGFATHLIISLLICIIVSSNGFGIFMVVLTAIAGFAFTLYLLLRTDASPKRWIYIWAAILNFAAAITLVVTPTTNHLSESFLNRFVIYSIVCIGMSSTISCFWPFVTLYTMHDVLEASQLDYAQESLLYTVMNMFFAVLDALLVACSNATKKTSVFKDGFCYSIIIWFVGAAAAGLLGWKIEGRSSPLAGAYESTPEPTAPAK